jgi:hypothetical protein
MNDLSYEIIGDQLIRYRKYCPCESCKNDSYLKGMTIQKSIWNKIPEELVDDIIDISKVNIINTQNCVRNAIIRNILESKYESK